MAAASQAPAAPALACAADAPPCGYITPILDLDFPDKPKCPGTPGSADPARAVDPSKCVPLPAEGAPLKFNGTVRWYWKESEDLTYPADPNQPIVITFGGTATNPTWLKFKVTPESYTLTSADLFDPRNVRNSTVAGQPVVYFWFERPVEVTFERHGGPEAGEMERFTERGGVQPVYVKAKSTASGGFYKESFGGEEFRFNATSLLAPVTQATTHASPAPVAAGMAPVAVLAARRRRRLA